MFNQFNNRRPFTPSTSARPLPGQGGPLGSSGATNSFGSQIRPTFLPTNSPSANSTQPAGPARRIQPDGYTSMTPQAQRAALFDQARQQSAHQARFVDPRTNLSSALPGGLTLKQRMDFETLRRTDPLAAQKQLYTYQRNSDVRHNKPTASCQPPAGPSYHRPSPNFNGPRRSFGA